MVLSHNNEIDIELYRHLGNVKIAVIQLGIVEHKIYNFILNWIVIYYNIDLAQYYNIYQTCRILPHTV